MPSNQRVKRPHFVPATYLRAWANGGDQIAARRRVNSEPYITNVINVTVEAGIYGSGQAGQLREEMFSSLEKTWPQLREALVAHGGGVPSQVRDQISLFIAFQNIRTRERIAQAEFLNSFAEFSTRRPADKDDIRRFLAENWLRFPPSESEVEAAWTWAYVSLNQGDPPDKNEVMGTLLTIAVSEIAPRIASFHWTVEHCRKPMLFTSDQPVMYWRPRSSRDKYEGIGLEGAEEIRVPITPRDLLVLRPAERNGVMEQVQPRRFNRVNDDIASQCHETVIAAPSRFHKLQELELAVHRPILRFNMAPGVEQLPDGQHRPMGDILHMWMPTYAN